MGLKSVCQVRGVQICSSGLALGLNLENTAKLSSTCKIPHKDFNPRYDIDHPLFVYLCFFNQYTVPPQKKLTTQKKAVTLKLISSLNMAKSHFHDPKGDKRPP